MDMPTWYHTLPSLIDPVAFSLGGFSVRWYGLWVAGGAALVIFLWRRAVVHQQRLVDEEVFWGIVLGMLGGAFVGARLGYAVLYDPVYFSTHPGALFFPSGGFAGLSFYGGLVGGIVALRYCARRAYRAFFSLTDSLALWIPIGIFCGRIGNFLNGELYGRVTSTAWGMVFPRAADGFLRYPSQILEALAEGVLLSVILWWAAPRVKTPGAVSWIFVVGYSVVRFGVEFWRAPDPQVGFVLGWLTLGQILSLIVGVIGVIGWRISTARATLNPVN